MGTNPRLLNELCAWCTWEVFSSIFVLVLFLLLKGDVGEWVVDVGGSLVG